MKGFSIEYRSITPFIISSNTTTVDIGTFNITLQNLFEYTSYEIAVSVRDTLGSGEKSAINITTREAGMYIIIIWHTKYYFISTICNNYHGSKKYASLTFLLCTLLSHRSDRPNTY